MLVGVTLIANGIELNYPFEVCIQNMLDCCEHVFVNTDINNRDNTLEQLEWLSRNNGNRLTVLKTKWNWNITSGRDLAFRANQCLDEALKTQAKSVLYLQADEIVNPKDILKLVDNQTAFLYNIALQRLYFWQNLQHINRDWTMPLPRLCLLTPRLRVVGDGMSMSVDHLAGTYLHISSEIASIFHYSRVGNSRLIAKRLNKLDSLFHESEEYKKLEDYIFGQNNNFETGADIAEIETVNIEHPPGVKEFFNG
jgi:hypothetical protein